MNTPRDAGPVTQESLTPMLREVGAAWQGDTQPGVDPANPALGVQWHIKPDEHSPLALSFATAQDLVTWIQNRREGRV